MDDLFGIGAVDGLATEPSQIHERRLHDAFLFPVEAREEHGGMNDQFVNDVEPAVGDVHLEANTGEKQRVVGGTPMESQ